MSEPSRPADIPPKPAGPPAVEVPFGGPTMADVKATLGALVVLARELFELHETWYRRLAWVLCGVGVTLAFQCARG